MNAVFSIFLCLPVVYEAGRVTATQVKDFLVCCRDKFMRAKIEPGNLVCSRLYIQILGSIIDALV